jgi:hypothetical protein
LSSPSLLKWWGKNRENPFHTAGLFIYGIDNQSILSKKEIFPTGKKVSYPAAAGV